MNYIKRLLTGFLEETIASRPLIYLNGPRQVGKSTLVQNLSLKKEANYITFDSPLVLSAARADPAHFIQSLPEDKLNILDEVQLVPEIYPHLKIDIDEKRLQKGGKSPRGREKGLYLLTGSANLMALPELSKALVGRMSVLTLLPFASAELQGQGGNFIERLFREDPAYSAGKYDFLDMMRRSTFPEPALHPRINKIQWFDDYVATILQRDVVTLSDIRNPAKVIRLLSVLAMRAGGLLNNNQAASDAGLDIKTYERYKAAVINTFMVFEMLAWAKPNRLNKRFVKSAKLFFYDTNLLAYLMKRDLEEILKHDRDTMGHLFENYIASEIMKQLSVIPGCGVFHFRTSDRKELDFVIEQSNGDTLGIEVKLGASLSDQDFNGLRLLREAVGKKFKRGVVIHTGHEAVPWGDNLWALPVSYLWS